METPGVTPVLPLIPVTEPPAVALTSTMELPVPLRERVFATRTPRLHDGLQGLITVEGGKFTTSRNLAEKAIDLVEKKLGRRHTVSPTAKRFLWGSQIRDMQSFILDIRHKNRDFDETTLEYLGRNYGTEFEPVLDLARRERPLSEILNDDGEVLSQAVYAVRHEMARTLSDIVLRRTGIATLGNPGLPVLENVAQLAAKELGWDGKKIETELADTLEALGIPGS
jgi:glycerol-3-phosphate dehydrogenase